MHQKVALFLWTALLLIGSAIAPSSARGPGMMGGGRTMGPGMMDAGPFGSRQVAGGITNESAGPDVASEGVPVAQRIVISVLPGALPGPDGKRHDAFMPADFVLKAGAKTTLIIVNYDDVSHSITAPELNMNIVISAATPSGVGGQHLVPSVSTYPITPEHKGLVRWYCITPCDAGASGWAMTPGFDGMGRDGYMAGYFAVI